MTANIRSFTSPLAQDLPQRRHTDGFLFSWFSEGVDLPRKSLCAFCYQTLITAGTSWWICLLEWRSSWTNPPSPDWSLVLSSCPWFPVALVHRGSVPRAQCRVTPKHIPLPRRQAGHCREHKQLSKAASSARLMTKESH